MGEGGAQSAPDEGSPSADTMRVRWEISFAETTPHPRLRRGLSHKGRGRATLAALAPPKSRHCRLEPAADAHRGDLHGKARRIVGLHRDTAQRRDARGGLEAAGGDARGEATQ